MTPQTYQAIQARIHERPRSAGVSMFGPVRYGLALLLIILLLTVESSLQTSIIWDRTIAWTPWLYKIGAFSMADLVIIGVTAFTLLCLSLRASIPRSAYLAVCGLAVGYLGIGLIYNLLVYTFWKAYFYDVKDVLYLIIPYLFLRVAANSRIRHWFTLQRVFLYAAIAAVADFVIVTVWGNSEYPSYLGLPAFPMLVPFSVILAGGFFAKTWRQRGIFVLLFLFEVVNAANRLSLGVLFGAGITFGTIIILMLRLKFTQKFVLMLLWFLASQVLYHSLLANPYEIPFLATKSEGSVIRQVQFENAVLNFRQNIPGVFGKGLGSTWFEYAPIPDSAGYSIGTSVGATTEEAVDSPVKFVFNIGSASMLHKWGILGSLVLLFLLVRYFHLWDLRLRRLQRVKLKHEDLQFPLTVLVISFLFVMENFTYIGNLKLSLMTSVLAFCVEDGIRQRQAIR